MGNNEDEYEAINKMMDSSLTKKEANDPITDQRRYLLFKSIYAKKDKTVAYYDPSDRMITESIIHVMVATMKQIKLNIQRKIGKGNIDDSIPIYVPTVLVVNEFASNMLLSEHFKTIVFGIHYKSNKMIDEAKLISLAKTLANKTLHDFIAEKGSFKEYEESNDGTNILSKLSGCNYETRYKIWFNKIKSLLLNSDELWLLNQFQYCKALLFNNSYEMEIDDIPEYLFKIIPYLIKLKQNIEIKNNMHSNEKQNEWNVSDPSKIDESNSNKSPTKVKMLNIPSLIGFFIGNESRINKIYKDAAKLNNSKKLEVASELMIKRENQAIIKITSSNFNLTHKALNKSLNS